MLQAAGSAPNDIARSCTIPPHSKKSGKSTKKTGTAGRRRKRIETFSSYIYKVLKQVREQGSLGGVLACRQVSNCCR